MDPDGIDGKMWDLREGKSGPRAVCWGGGDVKGGGLICSRGATQSPKGEQSCADASAKYAGSELQQAGLRAESPARPADGERGRHCSGMGGGEGELCPPPSARSLLQGFPHSIPAFLRANGAQRWSWRRGGVGSSDGVERS